MALLPRPRPEDQDRAEPVVVPPAAIALIDSWLASLHGREMLSASEVRNVLLDVRNFLHPPVADAAA